MDTGPARPRARTRTPEELIDNQRPDSSGDPSRDEDDDPRVPGQQAGPSHRPVAGQIKARGFVLDRASGRPVPGVVVIATASPDDGISVTLAVHASDKAGYLAIGFPGAFTAVKHLWLQAVGHEDARIDLMILPWWNLPGPHFILHVDASSASCLAAPPFPSVVTPDLRDWELSPRSFTTLGEVVLGEDGCATGCETMLPSTVAERDLQIRRVIRAWQGESDVPERSNDGIEALDPWNVPFQESELSERILYGEVLEFRQRWYPLGHSLGEMVYSLPLAPCESVNVAVIDWSRQDSATRTDQIRSTEALLHKQRRDRTLEETVEAGLAEEQGGWSLMGGNATAVSAKEASQGQASATIPIEGIPVNFAGAASQSLGFGQMMSIGGGIANSWGNRDMSGESLQTLHDKTLQSTAVVRTLSSTVVVQSTQQESGTVQTRTVTNHNHCHALTMQYYEVLRHFRIETAFNSRRSVVLVPYKVAAIDWMMALRFRTILEAVVDTRVQGCFDALVRLRLSPGSYTIPAGSAGSESPGNDDGESTRAIGSFAVTLTTSPFKPSPFDPPTTWGEIWVDVWLNSISTWQTIWHKDSVTDGGTQIHNHTFPQQVSGLDIDPANIGKVQVRWQEENSRDFWDLEAIRITYDIKGEPGTHTLIDESATSVPANSRTNFKAIRYFERSGGQPLATDPLVVKPPPAAPAPPDAGNTPPKAGSQKPALRFAKEEDLLCEQRLLSHINGNLGFYSRAIWVLQDPSERRVMLDHALRDKPWLAGVVDDTPVGVSGTHVAFPYAHPEDQSPDEGDAPPPIIDIVSLPTRGLFAEAQLGHCNSCEIRDVTRFWQWEESPCPDKAPTIEGIRPGPAGQPVALAQGALPVPVVQVVSAPVAPDPVGLAAAFKVLGTPDIFRDMSGTKEVADILKGLASGAMTLADAQKLAEQVQKDLAAGAGKPKAGEGAKSTPNEPNAGKQIDKLNAIDYGKDKGLLTTDAAQSAAEGVVGGGGGGFWSAAREMLEQALLGATGSGVGVTASTLTPCINEGVTFAVQGAPDAGTVSWTGGGTPPTGAGPSFTTRFGAAGAQTVRASWATDAGSSGPASTVTVRENSGAAWVGQFPGSASTSELTAGFRAKADPFLAALTAAGATVDINQTFRPQKRAYLMHHAWAIARKGMAPAAVPPFNPADVPAHDPNTGALDICWLHHNASGVADLKASKDAAEAMVTAYGIAFPPAYPTNHSAGTAIDMDISWTGTLAIKDAAGTVVSITTTPRTGAGNTELHAVGATYGVKKLVGDAPHWSETGG